MHFRRRRSGDGDQVSTTDSPQADRTAEPEQNRFDYVTDAPITVPPEDRFNRAPFAQRIAHTILAQRDPASIVVGVYGPWGDGKTSLLNLIEHALGNDPHVVPIRFNPWRLGSEAEMFVGFFETLAEAIDAKLTTGRERVGKLLTNYGALLKPIPFAGGTAASAAAAVGGALSETSLSKARARIEQLLARSGLRVVILMDDIDRLDKTEIQAIFRLVKVAADFKHTAYVLAFDPSVVADALAERYAAGTSHGDSFMEKIVQLPLHLPPVAPEVLLRTTLENVTLALEQAGIELSEAEVGEFRSSFDRAVLLRIKTPRMGKRYGNAALFALPMIGDEVRPIDLLLIEAMRVFYPRLYEWVRTHDNAVIGIQHGAQSRLEAVHAELRDALAAATDGMTQAESMGAQRLLTALFPRTESAWENKMWSGEWDASWTKARRIASAQYFRRYFTYTVPAGDVRDSDIDALLTVLESPDHDGGDAAELVIQMLDTGGPETFLQKVGARKDALSPTAAERLILQLAAFSDQFPDRPGPLFYSTMDRAALLTSRLLEQVRPDDQLEVASTVVRLASRIPFAVGLLRCVRPQGDQFIKTLTLEQTAEVGNILAGRIVQIWEDEDPFETFGPAAANTLNVWAIYGDVDRLRECLRSRIAADLTNALRLMKAFLPQSWSLETGLPQTPEFGREAFDALVQYVDPADLFARLQEHFGANVGTGDFYTYEDLEPDARLANEFSIVHRVVLEETARAQDTPGPAT